MKPTKQLLKYIILILLGAGLLVLGYLEIIEDFWSGMGAGLLAVALLRMVQLYRLRTNPAYREKMEIETNDERNAFLRARAWSWAGYLFILIAGAAVIGFKIAGQDLLSQAASWAVCLILVLYWGAYLVLKKKY